MTSSKQDAFAWARAKGIKTIRLVVYQPRVDGKSEEVITLEDLEQFATTLRSRACSVENAKRDYGVVPMQVWNDTYLNQNPNEVECAFCRAKPTCPTANRTLQEFMMAGFDPVIEGTVEPPASTLHEKLEEAELSDSRNELINKLMKLAPFVEDMLTAVRSEAERVLLAGVDLPDFGLDTGRKGARKFIDEEEADTLLNKQMRLSRELIYNFKLKTPTQLEKLTKPTKDEETGVETPPVLGPTRWSRVAKLVTQNDPQPSVKPKKDIKKDIKKPYVVPKPSIDGFEAVDDEEQLF